MGIRRTVLVIGASCFLALPSFAEDLVCSPDHAIWQGQVGENLDAACCARPNARQQGRCLNRAARVLHGLRATLGAEFAGSLRAVAVAKRQAGCEVDVPLAGCGEETSVLADSIVDDVSERCCGRRTSLARRRCLNNQIQRLRSTRNLTGAAVSDRARVALRQQRRQNCGIEEPKNTSSCQVYRPNTDGLGGWLHKPVSDSTRSIVNLFRREESPTSCRYELENGKLVRSAYSSGRHNGHRVHIRPTGGGNCRSFPNNMVINCSIGGRRVCYRIPDPCRRYD